MLQLDVRRIDDDVEAVVVPAVPDRREQDAAAPAVRGEDGNERLLEQIRGSAGPSLCIGRLYADVRRRIRRRL